MSGVAFGCTSLAWVVLGRLSQTEVQWWRRLLQTEHNVNRATPDKVLF